MVKRNIIEVGAEAIELSLKQAIDESVLKEIPVVGWLAKLYDSVSSVRERLEVEKLTKFLKAVNDVSEKDKYRFREKVLSNKESGQKLTKKIILVLENQSDIEKSEIVANFFIAYLDSRINESFFRRALDIISSSFLDDIQSFLEERANRSVMRSTYDELESNGLGSLAMTPLIGPDKTSISEFVSLGYEDIPKDPLFTQTDFGSEFFRAYHYGKAKRA